MFAELPHHTLRMEDLRREAAEERRAREALAARKQAGGGSARFRLPALRRRGPGTKWARAA